MESKENRYLRAVAAAIMNVAELFRNEPASFLYETDLRGLLFTRIFDRLSDSARSWKPTDECWAGVADGRRSW